MKKADLTAELRKVQGRRKVLRPVDVVAAAEPEDHPLHPQFEWDNSKAGHAYRVWQARQLIAVCVNYVGDGGAQLMDAYVSLKDDRKLAGGGYRSMGQVMAEPELRRQMLGELLIDLRMMEKKYRGLLEIANAWDSLHATTAAVERAAVPKGKRGRSSNVSASSSVSGSGATK